MASLQKRNGSYRVLFMHHGKLQSFTIGKVKAKEAHSKVEQVDYLLMRIEQGYEQVPETCDIVTYLKHDGKPPQAKTEIREVLTLAGFRDQYLATHSGGTLEEITVKGILQHFRRWVETLGEDFQVQRLALSDLQGHVDGRGKMNGVRGKVSAATIKKELATLRACWNWAVQFGLVSGAFPNRGLRFPKMDEKPPFMTWKEIERQITAGAASDTLWECLYLTLPEIEKLLNHVMQTAIHDFIYPMFTFSAHTGARRSELLRAQVSDLDFEGETVLIREKKRIRGQRTHRRVPLTPRLKTALVDWMEKHPGGPHLFCQNGNVAHSRKDRTTPTAITMDEAHDHFQRTLAGSRWMVLKGWHVLRHSFISACASNNLDQRLIDEWVGHTTEEMRRRYRHLYPSTQQAAIRLVFPGA